MTLTSVQASGTALLLTHGNHQVLGLTCQVTITTITLFTASLMVMLTCYSSSIYNTRCSSSNITSSNSWRRRMRSSNSYNITGVWAASNSLWRKLWGLEGPVICLWKSIGEGKTRGVAWASYECALHHHPTTELGKDGENQQPSQPWHDLIQGLTAYIAWLQTRLPDIVDVSCFLRLVSDTCLTCTWG